MPYFTMRDGARVHAWVLGTGPKTCMLLHGYGADARVWIPYISTMLRRHRFILPDLRGFGRSNTASLRPDRAITQYVEDIDDLLDAVGCDEAKLGGLSMGAYICLHKQQVNQFDRITRCFVIDHPPEAITSDDWPYGMHPRVTAVSRQLVDCWNEYGLNDPTVPFKHLPKKFQRLYKAVHRSIAIHCLPRFYQKWGANIALRTWPYLHAFVLSLSWHTTTTCLADYLTARYDMRTHLQHINIPITIMMGAKSELFPNEGVKYLAAHIRNSTLIPFKHSGHALFLTEPLKLRREIQRFIEE